MNTREFLNKMKCSRGDKGPSRTCPFKLKVFPGIHHTNQQHVAKLQYLCAQTEGGSSKIDI